MKIRKDGKLLGPTKKQMKWVSKEILQILCESNHVCTLKYIVTSHNAKMILPTS